MVHSIQLLEEPPALPNTTGLAAAAAAASAPAGAAGAAARLPRAAPGGGGGGMERAGSDVPSLPCYQLPAAVQERMVVVDSEEGLALMEQALFPSSSSGGTSSVSSSTSSGGASGGSSSSSSGGETSSGGEAGSGGSGGGGSEPRGFGPAAGPFRLVVGIDCEWQPYSTRHGDAKTPVSLLQVKERGAAAPAPHLSG